MGRPGSRFFGKLGKVYTICLRLRIMRDVAVCFVWGVVYCLLGALTASHASDVVDPATTWTIKTPQDVGFDATRLDQFAKFMGGRGCVVRGGYLVFSWGDIAKRADVASACKPLYTHFLLAAVERGKLKNTDEPVHKVELRLFNLNASLDHKDRAITWRHLANQVSCYGVSERPGEAYDYSDYNMALFFDALFLKIYGSSYARVDRDVLRPLLTDILQCQDAPTLMAFGENNRPGRVGISPRDFSRFGLLYLRRGKWRGKQLVAPEQVKLVTTTPLTNTIPRTKAQKAEMIKDQRSIGGGNNQTDHLGSYSFAWWTNGADRDGRRHWPNLPHDAYAALGHGGIRGLLIVPSLDLVISWNDAKIESRESQNEAFGSLLRATQK